MNHNLVIATDLVSDPQTSLVAIPPGKVVEAGWNTGMLDTERPTASFRQWKERYHDIW